MMRQAIQFLPGGSSGKACVVFDDGTTLQLNADRGKLEILTASGTITGTNNALNFSHNGVALEVCSGDAHEEDRYFLEAKSERSFVLLQAFVSRLVEEELRPVDKSNIPISGFKLFHLATMVRSAIDRRDGWYSGQNVQGDQEHWLKYTLLPRAKRVLDESILQLPQFFCEALRNAK